MTGAPMPAGADAVCMLEDSSVEDGGSVVAIDHPIARGEAVRGVGEDVAAGDVVADGGHGGVARPSSVCSPTSAWPRCRFTPAHGSACCRPGTNSSRSQVRWDRARSATPIAMRSSPSSTARVGSRSTSGSSATTRRRWASPSTVPPTGATPRDQRRGERRGSRHRQGGPREAVSGDDAVDAGGDPTGQAVRLRHPRGTGTPVFGLPGNPVSAMVSFELSGSARASAAWPATAHSTTRWSDAVAETASPRQPDGKTHFVRSALSVDAGGVWKVHPVVGQDSHHLRAMADANALAVLPDGGGAVAGGIGRRHPDRPRAAGHRADPATRGPTMVTSVPVTISGRPPVRPRVRSRCRAHRRPAGRCPRPDPRRSAHLGHRPLQPPLRLLHARGGNDLPPPVGSSHLRRDRPGGTGGARPSGSPRSGSPGANHWFGRASRSSWPAWRRSDSTTWP